MLQVHQMTMMQGLRYNRRRGRGFAAFQAARVEGQQMTVEQALVLATENESEDSQSHN
jgi:hypothetical protein